MRISDWSSDVFSSDLQHSMAVIAHAGYHEYQGIATDLAERESIVRDLGDNKVLIMRNHGLLTVGRTAGEAFMWMYRAARACYMQLSFQQAGAELNPIPEEVQRSGERRGGKGGGRPCSSGGSPNH